MRESERKRLVEVLNTFDGLRMFAKEKGGDQ